MLCQYFHDLLQLKYQESQFPQILLNVDILFSLNVQLNFVTFYG